MSAHHPSSPLTKGLTLARRLQLALALTLVFAWAEAVAGWWAHSLALLGDAGHMLSDAMALGVSLLAAWFSKRPPSSRHSYGFVRAEILAALVNGLLMLLVVIGIALEAVERLQQPQPVAGFTVMAVAAVGLAVNAAVFALLHHHTHDLNVRAALLHVLGDFLGSVAALSAGAVVYFTGWTSIDPWLSLLICALILYSTSKLLREAVNVLMEGVPLGLDLQAVGRGMVEVPGILSVHDLHVWTLASGRLALSAHVVVQDLTQWAPLLERLRLLLQRRFNIDHVTLQPEPPPSAGQRQYAAVIPIRPEQS